MDISRKQAKDKLLLREFYEIYDQHYHNDEPSRESKVQ